LDNPGVRMIEVWICEGLLYIESASVMEDKKKKERIEELQRSTKEKRQQRCSCL